MEIVILFAFVAALTALAGLAQIYGVDSRDGIADPHQPSLLSDEW